MSTETTTPAKEPKKRSVERKPDGSRVVTFAGGGTYSYKASDYPQNVVDYFTALGMDTAHRNAGIGSETDGSVGTPEQMLAREQAKVEAWKRGELRIASDGSEKGGIPMLILEAGSIYKAMKACYEATGDIEGWDNAEAYPRPDPESLRAPLEALDDEVINPDKVKAAEDKARAEGKTAEEVAAAGEKARVTKLDEVRATVLFKAALTEAEDLRRAKKKAAQREALKAAAKKAGA